jgi:hypothetical protein
VLAADLVAVGDIKAGRLVKIQLPLTPWWLDAERSLGSVAMDYRTVRGIFFAEPKPGAPPPLATTTGTPARRLRDAIEPLACQSIWSEEAAERYVELGLDDWFAAYIWERTAALGMPPTALAVMAMGVWNAELIGPLFDKAVAAISREDIVATRSTAPGATVRRLLGNIDAEAAQVVEVLRRGIEAADVTARPLFAGLTAEPWPEDVAAQLVHACHLLREHRGDSHLAVCAVAGLDPIEMNILTALYCGHEPLTYTATRGWTQEQMTEALERLRARGLVSGSSLSEEGLRFRHHLEAQTDAMQQSIIDAVGSPLDSDIKQLDAWSNALIAAGGAPPDPARRASG